MELKEAFNIINDLCYTNHNNKVPNEVVDALKTIKEIVDLQEDFGGLFFVKLEYNKEFIINVETDEMFDSSYDIDDYDLKVKDYKKTWWFKEDGSE